MRQPYSGHDPIELYLDLLKVTLTRYKLEEYTNLEPLHVRTLDLSKRAKAQARLDALLRRKGFGIGRITSPDSDAREGGLDWPMNAETMIGLRRLDMLHQALDTIRLEGIPGSVFEAGVWRGGATIFMAGYLNVHNMERDVFVADSFEGLPPPDPAYPLDAGDRHHEQAFLEVGLETVRENFRKFGLLSEHVRFVKGYFEHSLKQIDIDQLALLRLDGDMYSSTMQVLEALYNRVTPGGFVVVDDYALRGARAAVHDFMMARSAQPEVRRIDTQSVYWRVE